LGAGDDVVWLAGGWGLVAAGEAAVPVAGGHGAAQVRGDDLNGGADVEGEADGGGEPVADPVAQCRGQAGGSRQQVSGVFDEYLAHCPFGELTAGCLGGVAGAGLVLRR
jgi:hypothetical protein